MTKTESISAWLLTICPHESSAKATEFIHLVWNSRFDHIIYAEWDTNISEADHTLMISDAQNRPPGYVSESALAKLMIHLGAYQKIPNEKKSKSKIRNGRAKQAPSRSSGGDSARTARLEGYRYMAAQRDAMSD